jgi:hypothetical protein
VSKLYWLGVDGLMKNNLKVRREKRGEEILVFTVYRRAKGGASIPQRGFVAKS